MKLKLIYQSRKLQVRIKTRNTKDLSSTQKYADSLIIYEPVTKPTVGKHKNTCSAYNRLSHNIQHRHFN